MSRTARRAENPARKCVAGGASGDGETGRAKPRVVAAREGIRARSMFDDIDESIEIPVD